MAREEKETRDDFWKLMQWNLCEIAVLRIRSEPLDSRDFMRENFVNTMPYTGDRNGDAESGGSRSYSQQC